MGVWQRLPVIRTALLDDPPVPRGCCNHRGALSWGDTLVTVRRLSPGSPASSTPHRSLLGHPHPTRFSLRHRDLWDWENAFSYTIKKRQMRVEAGDEGLTAAELFYALAA